MAAPIIRPDPDPTVLTTENLRREISNLKELQDRRLEDMALAMKLVQSIADKVPALVDEKVSHLADVMAEKFAKVNNQIVERDVRTDQRAGDIKVGVDAAFAAAKETAGKSEAGFTKQIDGLVVIIDTKNKNSEDKIESLKERINSIENRSKGSGDTWVWIFGAVGILIAFGALFLRHN
jgi:hypothetical protein